VIEIKLTFDTFEAAAVALSKLAEGKRLMNELADDTAAETTTETADATATQPARRRRTKAEIAADEAAKKAAEGKNAETTGTTSAATDVFDKQPEAAKAAEPAKAEGYETRFKAWLIDNAGKQPVDFLRSQLQRVVDKSGMDGTRAFMVAFGCPRVTEVTADKYDAFLTAVDNHVATPALINPLAA
jgi:hypothetical protein